MHRLQALSLGALLLAALPCLSQTPAAYAYLTPEELAQTSVAYGRLTPKELAQILSAGQPREVAWAAYQIGLKNRQELVPALIARLSSYKGDSSDKGDSSKPCMSIAYMGRQSHKITCPQLASMAAVADALIQLHATVPANVAMNLYPEFQAQTVILLSRASGNTGPLLQIFRTAPWRDLRLAAGNLLAVHPTPDFVRVLLDKATVSFNFRVVTGSDKAQSDGVGDGCASDFMDTREDVFASWPRIRMYALTTDNPSNVFASGIHPVGFFTWNTENYVDQSGPTGNCSAWKSIDWLMGLLAQLQGTELKNFPLKSEVYATVYYNSRASFKHRVKQVISPQDQAYKRVVQSFVRSGVLSRHDAAGIRLGCQIDIQDDRPEPREKLPVIEGKWCRKAAPALTDL